MSRACYECRHWSPGEHGASYEDGLDRPIRWDESMEGECRGSLPVLGKMLKDRHGDDFRGLGEWPRTLAGEWCSKFEKRQQANLNEKENQ